MPTHLWASRNKNFVTLTGILNDASYTTYYVYKNNEGFSGNALHQQEINYGVSVPDGLTR